MGMNGTQRIAYRILGPFARRSKKLERLSSELRKARKGVRPEAYLASAWLIGLATAAFFVLLGVLFVPVLMVRMGLPATTFVLIPLVAGMAGYIGYWAIMATPASEAKTVGKEMDIKLPYAVNYVAAMASAGVIPQDIFRSLSVQEIYGRVAEEASWIYKDLHVHGKDIITALRRSIDRSPSVKWQELLQGAITTITSGGDLTAYFRQKASRYQWENRVEQKAFIETMGLMAETYVTAAVAGPLFLLVMVAIIVLMGNGEMSQLHMLVYLLLPVINIGFMFGLKSMIPEV